MRGCRVLLVEDNPVNREVAQLLLEGHGVVVDEAASGIEALELFEENRYHAVLMDIQMPGMNGLEATARIRAHADPLRAATPILALTANAFRADAEKYAAAGMNDTLPKPFDESELLSKLASLIAGTDVPRLDPKPQPGTAAVMATAPPAATPSAAPELPPITAAPALSALFDLSLLRQTAHGSTVFMNRIRASFHTNTPGSVEELHTAWVGADWAAAAAIAHKLRPSLRLLGAAQLAPWLEILEAQESTDAKRYEATAGLAAGLEELLAVLPTEIANT